MLVINMVGGPGCGKSTTALGVASLLKQRTDLEVEYSSEVVRDFIYSGYKYKQRDITFGQYSKLLLYKRGGVDIVVQDCSLLNAIIYSPLESEYSLRLFNEFNNLSFLIPRIKGYRKTNREQTEEQAINIDNRFRELYNDANLELWDLTKNPSLNGYEEVIHYIAEDVINNMEEYKNDN